MTRTDYGSRTAALACALLFAPALQAAVYTVGPGGTHASLDAALAAAGNTAADDEIRIASGTQIGNVFMDLALAQTIEVSGGWDAGFALRGDDPEATLLQGVGNGTLLYVGGDTGRVEFSNLSLTHPGSTRSDGTCARLVPRGDMVLVLRDSVVRNCVTLTEFSCSAAGIGGYAIEDGRVELLRNHIRDNTCETLAPAFGPGYGGAGAGAFLGAEDNGTLVVVDNIVEGNLLLVDGGQGSAAGLVVNAYEDSSATVSGNRISGNVVDGEPLGESPTVSTHYGLELGVALFGGGSGQMQARGNIVEGNRFDAGSAGGAQVQLMVGGTGVLVFGDSEVSDGSGGAQGIFAAAFADTATLRMVNLTVAGNAGRGIVVPPWSTGQASLYNSIVAGHAMAPEFTAGVVTGSNLITDTGGADPQFVDAGAGDYRLLSTSPARDAGTGAPPGGLGATDARGAQRVAGAGVDIGAWEFGAVEILFADGFEGL